jgi:NitT/TauT family transport system substrate-binding protein
LAAFVRATREADSILATSDAEWNWLGPRTGARNAAELKALRDAFRAGIPTHWGRDEQREASALYALFAKVGGPALVGSSPALQPGTFLETVSY